jgi:predicted nucleic acid-binding protein
MPNPDRIVINTSPIIALTAAMGNLTVLQDLYSEILVPWEVSQEILAHGGGRFAAEEFRSAFWLNKINQPQRISPLLLNSLDRGEAAVIQLAQNETINTVCIDEAAGRRIARLSGLKLTGSIGILIRAKREGYLHSMRDAIDRMQAQGIRLSSTVIQIAIQESGE